MRRLYLTKKWVLVCSILDSTKEHKRQMLGKDMILWKKKVENQHDPNENK